MVTDLSKIKPILQQTDKMQQKMKGIKHKLMVMSGKGGVGKTTVAVNLAVALSNRGYKVGILDADMHGPNVPKMLGIPSTTKLYGSDEGIDPISVSSTLKMVSIELILPDSDTAVIWRGSLKHKAIQQFLEDVSWGELDYLVVDLPPGTGDEPLSVVQLIKEVDGVIIVITPQEVALMDAKKAINFARQVNVKVVGLIENMSGDVFGTGGGEKAAKDFSVPFLGRLQLNKKIVESGDKGIPFVLEPVQTDYIKEFNTITDKILNNIENKN